LAKLSGVTGDDQVARHGEFAASAECESVDRCDQRLGEHREHLPGAEAVVVELVHRRGLDHLLDVSTGREGAVISGQDDHANLRILI